MTQSVTCAAGCVVWRRQQAHCSCGRRWSVVVSKRSRTIHEYTPLAEPWWDLDVGGDLRACSYSVIAGTSTSSLDSVESKVFTARRFWHWKVLTGNTLFLLWESCKDNFFYGCSQCFVYGLVSSKILNPLTLSLESRIVLEWVMVCVTFLFFSKQCLHNKTVMKIHCESKEQKKQDSGTGHGAQNVNAMQWSN